jgi:hypothetical protein
MTYKEQAQLTQEACNVLIARLDCQKALCEAMEGELLQRHSTRETLEAAAAAAEAGNPTVIMHKKKAVTQGRDLVDVSSCVSLHAIDNHSNNNKDDEDDGNVLSELSEVTEDEVSTLRRQHQRKSLVRHAIKGNHLPSRLIFEVASLMNHLSNTESDLES